MINAQKIYLQKIKAAGLSNTKPRAAVFETLLVEDHHPLTMSELVAKTIASADRASVYRSVESLEHAGVIKRLHLGWKYKLELSDDFHGHHHHITCEKCGTTLAIGNDDVFEKTIHAVSSKYGYTVTDHQLDIRGVCQKCRRN